MGIVYALLSMLCFGGNIFITRVAMSRMSANTGFPVVLVVNILFAALVFGLERAWIAEPLVVQWKAAGWFALSGLVGIYMGRRMLFESVHVLGPARASVLHTASPAVTLVAAWVFIGERLGAYEIALIAMVMGGLLIAQLQHAGAARVDNRAALRKAMLISLLTIVGFGVGNAIRGMAIREWNEAALGAVLGSAAALLAQLTTGSSVRTLLAELRKGDKGAIALYVASGVATVSGTMFGAMAMQRVEIAIATVITYTTPLVVFPVSVFVLKNREELTLRTALGALLVLTGIALIALR